MYVEAFRDKVASDYDFFGNASQGKMNEWMDRYTIKEVKCERQNLVGGCSLYISFNFSLCLKIFIIKYREKIKTGENLFPTYKRLLPRKYKELIMLLNYGAGSLLRVPWTAKRFKLVNPNIHWKD